MLAGENMGGLAKTFRIKSKHREHFKVIFSSRIYLGKNLGSGLSQGFQRLLVQVYFENIRGEGPSGC